MNIVGKTGGNTIYIARKDKAFQIDEYFVIEDERNNNPVCRVIKTEEYKDVKEEDELLEATIQHDLKGLNLMGGTICIATAKLEKETSMPITPRVSVRSPEFKEIKKLLYSCSKDSGLVLGAIRGSESMFDSIEDSYSNISPMFNGESIINQTGLPFIFDFREMQQFPNLGLFGGSGSGKTYGLKVLLEEIIKKRIPNLVLDPHYEMNFSENRGDLPEENYHDFSKDFTILTIGQDVGIDFEDLTTDEFLNIIQFAGDMSQPMISSLRELHDKGDSFVFLNKKLEELINIFDIADKTSKMDDFKKQHPAEFAKYQAVKTRYSGLATLTALSWRIKALEAEGVFGNGIAKVQKGLFERKTVVLRGTNRHLNIVSSYILKKFFKKRKKYIDDQQLGRISDYFPPFITTMDESHIFAPKAKNISSPMKSILRTMAQEGRKYGLFEILATQRPCLLDETIVAQMSTKIIFRTTIGEDIKMIETETDLSSEDITRLPYLSSGNAFVSSAILGRTMSIRFRSNFTTPKISEHPFDELDKLNSNDDIDDFLLVSLPLKTMDLSNIMIELNQKGYNLSVKDITEKLDNLAKNNKLIADSSPMGKRYVAI